MTRPSKRPSPKPRSRDSCSAVAEPHSPGPAQGSQAPRRKRAPRLGQARPPKPAPAKTGAARPGRAALTPPALLGLYRPDISQALIDAGAPPFRQAQVLEHLLRRPHLSIAEATVLPGGLRVRLEECGETSLQVEASLTAADGTVKFLLSAADGARIETVLMPYRDRVTVCVSTQVGCPVGCAFCATGGMGFRRNLSVAEIVDQVRPASISAASQDKRISNVVYMGMGEPLLNLGAVLGSIKVLTAARGLGMAHRALSVSTIGIPAGITRLGREEPQVNLALSLHAADDETRARLVPDRYRHPLSDILDAAWEHFAMTHRKLLVEYVLLGGVNDSPEDARRLAALLRGHVVTVNLLAWNPVDPRGPALPRGPAGRTAPEVSGRSKKAALPPGPPAASTVPAVRLRPPAAAAVAAFLSVLREAHVETVVRRSRGVGIGAACGQLAARPSSYRSGGG